MIVLLAAMRYARLKREGAFSAAPRVWCSIAQCVAALVLELLPGISINAFKLIRYDRMTDSGALAEILGLPLGLIYSTRSPVTTATHPQT